MYIKKSAKFQQFFTKKLRLENGEAAFPETARAGGGAAPFGRAGPRVARYFHHHPAGSRGLVARG